MDLANEFTRLTTKFLFMNCNEDRFKASELNAVLNDLIDYIDDNYKKRCWKSIDEKAILRIFISFTNIEPSQEAINVKACHFITLLLNKQRINELTKDDFHKISTWLEQCTAKGFSKNVCAILAAQQAMFKCYPKFVNECTDIVLEQIDVLLENLSHTNKEINRDFDLDLYEEIFYSTIQCIDTMLPTLLDVSSRNTKEESQSAKISSIGNRLIELMYSDCFSFKSSINHLNVLAIILKLLYNIAFIHKEWLIAHIGELLGISKAYMHFGLSAEIKMRPQKVHMSQQSVLDAREEVAIAKSIDPRCTGGKIAKTRKPRSVHKNSRKLDCKKHKSPESFPNERPVPGTLLKIDYDIPSLLATANIKTSESEFSESEGALVKNEKHKEAKVRLAAISLISLLANNTEKRLFYGYWHSLFPTNETVAKINCGLLNCVIRDPNTRCRIAALQTATIILYGSRPFLLQAETSEKIPTTFMPFSLSLGQMIITMYEILTQGLAVENSLPVLTQILKCLTVLIQATPFHRLKSGFVEKFVSHVRHLVYHKDSNVQTAALMVMEFLISLPEITQEISKIVEIPKTNSYSVANQNKLIDNGIDEVFLADSYEEIIEPVIDAIVTVDNSMENSEPDILAQPEKMSWLLQCVLENLDVIGNETDKPSATPTPVRVECLQILSSMSRHFSLLQPHLQLVANALKASLCDNQQDVRLYSAKCLDSLGNAINTYLLENVNISDANVLVCQNFWTTLLPFVIEKIQDKEQSAAFKSTLCDFLSNIGVHIFERLSYTFRIKLISLLSGESCNVEENMVRAAAVRALAVYVLFPSLREDLVFVENTAMSAINIIRNSNQYVRVKASWSMGNVSDALIKNCFESRLDRVSDNLLQEMLQTSIESANDNDKVRSNIVRVMGNLLRLMTIDHLEKLSWRILTQNAIEQLVNSSNSGGNAKVKWNSCYAIGNFMKNEALFDAAMTFKEDFNWPALVFPTLCNLIVNHMNFKVRTNGTAALVTIEKREHYGKYYQLVWSSLLDAMEQSEFLIDFNEYNHRDNLQEQLCMAISHIVRISSNDDLQMLKSCLVAKLEIIRQIWLRVINRILPENSASLLACSPLLQKRLKNQETIDSKLTPEQCSAIRVLVACFTEPIVVID